jgi:hypothetical protein
MLAEEATALLPWIAAAEAIRRVSLNLSRMKERTDTVLLNGSLNSHGAMVRLPWSVGASYTGWDQWSVLKELPARTWLPYLQPPAHIPGLSVFQKIETDFLEL